MAVASVRGCLSDPGLLYQAFREVVQRYSSTLEFEPIMNYCNELSESPSAVADRLEERLKDIEAGSHF